MARVQAQAQLQHPNVNQPMKNPSCKMGRSSPENALKRHAEDRLILLKILFFERFVSIKLFNLFICIYSYPSTPELKRSRQSPVQSAPTPTSPAVYPPGHLEGALANLAVFMPRPAEGPMVR